MVQMKQRTGILSIIARCGPGVGRGLLTLTGDGPCDRRDLYYMGVLGNPCFVMVIFVVDWTVDDNLLKL